MSPAVISSRMAKFIFGIWMTNLWMSPAFAIDILKYASIHHSTFLYNHESTSSWEIANATQNTITYFGNVLEPVLQFDVIDKIHLKTGVGLYLIFDQEVKYGDTFPIIQTRLDWNESSLIIGTLENRHRFPAPILHPLIELEPKIRKPDADGVRFSHGRYEYGLQYLIQKQQFWGDLYLNWQLLDRNNHKERFDAGLSIYWDISVPLYTGAHHWHNGGHEQLHVVPVAENYNFAFGLRKKYSLLYFASFDIPNRKEASTHSFGQALYLDIHFPVASITLKPIFWITDQFLFPEHRYVTVEGDIFFNSPLYAGLDVDASFQLHENVNIRGGLINGLFLPPLHRKIDWGKMQIRYDQLLNIELLYHF